MSDSINIMDGLAGLSFKLAAGMGGLVTFLYLFSIQFFPSALTPGEVVFFLFVAFAFGFVYIVFTLYSVFSMIWVVSSLTWVFKQWDGRAPRASETKLYKILSGYAVVSFLAFALFLLAVLARPSPRLIQLVIVAFTVGFLVLCVTCALAARPAVDGSSGAPARWRWWAGWLVPALIPFVLVCLFIGPRFFTHIVFSGIGVRAENVTVELAESEIGPVTHAATLLGRPLIDCRKSGSDKLLVHGVNILWGGIGDKTLIELVVNGKEEPWYAFTMAKPLKSITIPFEAKHVRPIKASPALDRCFELPSDLLFDTAQFSLSAAALARLERLAANLAPGERVARLHVHGHSDARQLTGTALDKSLDNQKLSEFRARAVGQALQRILKLEADQITSGGAGSREPLVKCERSTVSTRYELEQCNRPNRRVEIKVTLFNNGTADKASP